MKNMDKRIIDLMGFISLILITSITLLLGWNFKQILIFLNIYTFIIAFALIIDYKMNGDYDLLVHVDDWKKSDSIFAKFLRWIVEKLGGKIE